MKEQLPLGNLLLLPATSCGDANSSHYGHGVPSFRLRAQCCVAAALGVAEGVIVSVGKPVSQGNPRLVKYLHDCVAAKLGVAEGISVGAAIMFGTNCHNSLRLPGPPDRSVFPFRDTWEPSGRTWLPRPSVYPHWPFRQST